MILLYMKGKAFIHRLLTAAVALVVMSCSSDEAQVQAQNYATMTQKMYITIARAYTLQGTLAQTETKGVIIKNGKKIFR